MSDTTDAGASAPSESTAAPADQVQAPPNPIATEPQKAPEPKPAEPAKPEPTPRDALKRAAEKVAKSEAAAKDDKATPEGKTAPVKTDAPGRDPAGKFAPKDTTNQTQQPQKPVAAAGDVKPADTTQTGARAPHDDPPTRFSADAKTAWATAPDNVRAETHRAIRELEQGFEKHRASAEAYESIREYDELAKQHNTSVRDALTRYTTLERTLAENPMKGLEEVCNYVGMSLRQVAEHVLGMTPDQAAAGQDQTIRELREQVSSLHQQVGGVTSTFQRQQRDAVSQDITAFASKPENARFDELSPVIAQLLKTGMAGTLPDAYQMAERLHPAPQSPASAPAASAASQDLTAQTQKGSQSIKGAPTTGSDPAERKSSSSIKEALKRAAAAAG